MHNDSIVDLTTMSKIKEVETSLRNEIHLAKDDIIRDLQKKEEYLIRLIRVLIAKIDALEKEKTEAVIEKPQLGKKRLFRL